MVGIETMELKDIISILIGAISLAVAIVTAYNTKKISDIQRKKEITKIDNSENRLAVSLNTYMTIYNHQKDIVMKIFSLENREKFLYKIMDNNSIDLLKCISIFDKNIQEDWHEIERCINK